jgi:hypothetical protein
MIFNVSHMVNNGMPRLCVISNQDLPPYYIGWSQVLKPGPSGCKSHQYATMLPCNMIFNVSHMVNNGMPSFVCDTQPRPAPLLEKVIDKGEVQIIVMLNLTNY